MDEFVESAKEYAKISIQRHYDDMRFAAAGQTYGVELLNKARQRFYKSFRPFTQESSSVLAALKRRGWKAPKPKKKGRGK